MINIGTCNLHVVHNSFCKALEAYGTPVDDLAVDIHSFFKISSARRVDFKFIQLEEEVETYTFLRHVPSRWLRLGPVVDRLIEQWEPLQKYFTDLANKDPKNTPTSFAFKRSCTRLNKQTLVELHFLQSVTPLCRPRWLSWMRRPTGDQEVAGSTPAEVSNILSWRLIMKYFLRSFSPFHWFKKGSELSVSGEGMCTILVNRLEDKACPVNMWLVNWPRSTWPHWVAWAVKPQHTQTSDASVSFISGIFPDRSSVSSCVIWRTVSACLHDDGQICQSICISE